MRGMEIFSWCLIGILFINVVQSGDDFNESIECYYCVGDSINSTCAQPTKGDLENSQSGITKIECKRGACLKLVKRNDEGVMTIQRTCSHRIPNFHIIMAEVCRYESNGNGYLCMCAEDFCNYGNVVKFNFNTMAVVLIFSYGLLS